MKEDDTGLFEVVGMLIIFILLILFIIISWNVISNISDKIDNNGLKYYIDEIWYGTNK